MSLRTSWRRASFVPVKKRALRRIGLLCFDGINALDVVGPAETFALARSDSGDSLYQVLTLGLGEREVIAESGIVLRPQISGSSAPPLDTLIIPGGSGLRQPSVNRRAAALIAALSRQARRIASVCTGIYALAPTGLLDGRRVTTHWRFAGDVAHRFPSLRVDASAVFIKDGRFYTSAGITAGIDLSLALVEEDFGPAAALAIARELVVYLKRPGDQEQYAEPLQFQMESKDAFADLVAWLAAHLHAELSVEALARRCSLSPRQFSRRFRRAFSMTPAAFVQRLRLDEARKRLARPDARIKQVAASVGFRSDDVFRRAFERRYGIPPGAYRGRFETTGRGR